MAWSKLHVYYVIRDYDSGQSACHMVYWRARLGVCGTLRSLTSAIFAFVNMLSFAYRLLLRRNESWDSEVFRTVVMYPLQQQGRRGRQSRRIDTRGPGRRSCFVARNLIIFLAREFDGFPLSLFVESNCKAPELTFLLRFGLTISVLFYFVHTH